MIDKHYLYSDGNRFPKINRSGFGGYIQNSQGVVLVEFSREIEQQEQKHNFEVLGIITGIEVAVSMGIKHLHCKCDDKTLMLHINACCKDAAHIQHIYGNKKELVQQVLNLRTNFESIDFEYVPRNENKYSDSLSRKYISVLERNFLADHAVLLKKSRQYFKTAEVPAHSVYFVSDKLINVPYENNPFLVSQKKNKKQKEFRKSLEPIVFEHWAIDAVYSKKENKKHYKDKQLSGICLKKYNPQTLGWEEVDQFMLSSDSDRINLNDAVEIFTQSMKTVAQQSRVAWVSSNIESMMDVIYQKKPISREIFPKFVDLSNSMLQFDKIIFHRTPKEIEHKIKQKLSKIETRRSVEQTVALIQASENLYKKNKYFGQLMSIMIKEILLKNPQKSIDTQEKQNLKNQLISKHDIKLKVM